MRFVAVRRGPDQTTIVNVDQITHLNHDIYGTKIYFASGESIICPDDVDELSRKLCDGDPYFEHWMIAEGG